MGVLSNIGIPKGELYISTFRQVFITELANDKILHSCVTLETENTLWRAVDRFFLKLFCILISYLQVPRRKFLNARSHIPLLRFEIALSWLLFLVWRLSFELTSLISTFPFKASLQTALILVVVKSTLNTEKDSMDNRCSIGFIFFCEFKIRAAVLVNLVKHLL